MTYDLVICGGLVVDGTEAEPFKADIAVIRRTDKATDTLPGWVVRVAQATPV